MYVIKKQRGFFAYRRFNNKVFNTYEEARTYVRKWIRKNKVNYTFFENNGQYNPSISFWGFKIVKNVA